MADKYVKLNDGRYIRFDDTATKDYMRSTILKVSPNEFGPPAAPPKEGLWDKLKDFGKSLENPSMLGQVRAQTQGQMPGADEFNKTDAGQALAKGKAFAEKPLLSMPEIPKEVEGAIPAPMGIPSPVAEAALKTASGMTSPENIGLLLSLPFAPENVVGKLAGGFFAGQMAQGSLEKGVKAVQSARQGNTDQALEQGTEAALSAGMIGLGFQGGEKTGSTVSKSARSNDLLGDLSGQNKIQGLGGQPAVPNAPETNLNRFNTAANQARARKAQALKGTPVQMEMPTPKPAPEDVAGAIAHLPEDTTFQNQTSAIAKKFNVSNDVAAQMLREHLNKSAPEKVAEAPVPPRPEPATPIAPEPPKVPEPVQEATTPPAPSPEVKEAKPPAEPYKPPFAKDEKLDPLEKAGTVVFKSLPKMSNLEIGKPYEVSRDEKGIFRFKDQEGNVDWETKGNLRKSDWGPAPNPTRPITPPSEPKTQSAMTERTAQLEEQIRPKVGKLLLLKDLLTGNRAHQAIEDAKEATFSSGGVIDSETRRTMSLLLKEDVGDKLTSAQVSRLDMILGRTKGETPQLQRLTGFKIKTPEMQEKLKASRERMIEDFNNTTDPTLKAQLDKALTPDAKGNPQPFLYQPRMSYPKPVDLPAEHPLAPFTKKGFPARISPISLDNLEAAMGKRPRTLDMGLMTSEEKAQLTSTTKPTSLDRTKSDIEKTTDLYNEWAVAHQKTQATPTTLVKTLQSMLPEDQKAFMQYAAGERETHQVSLAEAEETGLGVASGERRTASPEQRRLRNSIYENAVRKEILNTRKELKDLAGQWNLETSKAPAGLLREQLDRLDSLSKRALPEELYAKEFTSAPASKAPSAANFEEPVKAPAKAEKPATPEATPISGIETKISALTEKIEDKFPDHVEGISNIMDSVFTTFKDEASQLKFLHAALKTFVAGLEKDDEFALKRAFDVIKRKGETGSIGDINPYTPAETQQIAGERANAILLRYESMTPLALGQYKESLWAPDLKKMVLESQDPDIAQRYKAILGQLPESRSPEIALRNVFENQRQAAEAKGVIRAAAGTWHRNGVILKHQAESLDQLMNSLTISESMRFMDHMEMGIGQIHGLFDTLRPDFRQEWERKWGLDTPHPDDVALAIRGILDRARNDLTTETGRLEEYIANYLPHIFANVGKATDFAKMWVTRRSLEGSTGFLRHREYEFIKDATTEGGLQLVTYNPVRLSLLRIAQLDRYTMAHKIKNGFVERGLAQHFQRGQQPTGWIPLNDNMFEPKSYSEEEGGMVNRGQYYAPESVAKVFNNFVSNGLAGRGKIPYTNFSLYDAMRGYGNLANQFELSFSLFHGVETLLNSAITDASLAMMEGVNEGKIVSPSARILRASTLFAPVIRHTYYGSHMLAEIKDPGRYLDMVQAAKDFETAGGRTTQDPLFRTHQVEALKRNWKIATDELRPTFDRMKAGGKLIPNLAGSVVETTAWPLMNALIPRVKAGVFFDLARQVRSEYEGQSEDIISGELQKAWDSIDNRFGEVVYDNLFMNRVFKDAIAIGFRSPAWNIGTVRELGGGILDAGRSIKDATTRRERIKITNRTAYTMALVGMTAYVNALYQHLHPHAPPPQGIDYFYPQDGTKNSNGEPNRVYPKLYTYDAINWYKHPALTTLHKASPLVSGLLELYNNADYFGREIVDPNDPFPTRMAAIANYAFKQYEPFSFSNWRERQLRSSNQTTGSLVESTMGILPAPKWVGQSSAEQTAYGYLIAHQSQGPEDPADFERKREFIDLRNKVVSGKYGAQELNDALAKGTIKPRQLRYMFETGTKTNLQRWVPQLTTVQAFKVWDQASDAEKQQLLPILFKKAAGEGIEQQKVYIQKIEDYMKSKQAP